MIKTDCDPSDHHALRHQDLTLLLGRIVIMLSCADGGLLTV